MRAIEEILAGLAKILILLNAQHFAPNFFGSFAFRIIQMTNSLRRFAER